ncbi:MAG: hypothetical protein HQ543_04395 [Bacteroidetes bacterium]|nr:hypothetical protein [Bacteroidota bacterium]
MKKISRIKFTLKDKNYRLGIILFALFALAVIISYGCDKNKQEISNVKKEVPEKLKVESNKEIAVEAPPFTEGIFPCMDCHIDFESDPVRRELFMHDDISAIFDHDSENRWCLDCHDMNSRDSLKLASGKLLDFKESYKLCGQCHGEKLRDWKIGVHGKRTGDWNGEKKYYLCVHCHNPHSPKFKPIKPEPPPIRQEEIN